MVQGARRLMPRRLRDTGNGLINAGWAAGALIAPLVVAPIAARHGWEASFVVTGGVCFLWLPLWLVFAYRPGGARLGPQPVALRAGSDHAARPMAWRSYALWATVLAVFFTVPPTVFTNAYVPLYLNEVHGVAQAQVAWYYWQPFLATDVGQITGGLVVYGLLRRGWGFLAARRVVMTVGFVGAVVLLGMNGADTPGRAVAWLDGSRLLFQVGYTVLVAYGIESVAEHQTALMAGLLNATFAACNFVFNPLIGAMADRYGG